MDWPLHVLAVLSPHTHWTWGSVGPTAGLDEMTTTKNPAWNRTPDLQPVSSRWLIYHGSLRNRLQTKVKSIEEQRTVRREMSTNWNRVEFVKYYYMCRKSWTWNVATAHDVSTRWSEGERRGTSGRCETSWGEKWSKFPRIRATARLHSTCARLAPEGNKEYGHTERQKNNQATAR